MESESFLAYLNGSSLYRRSVLPRQQKATGFARGWMRQRLAGMSPHLGVKKGTTGFARGAPPSSCLRVRQTSPSPAFLAALWLLLCYNSCKVLTDSSSLCKTVHWRDFCQWNFSIGKRNSAFQPCILSHRGNHLWERKFMPRQNLCEWFPLETYVAISHHQGDEKLNKLNQLRSEERCVTKRKRNWHIVGTKRHRSWFAHPLILRYIFFEANILKPLTHLWWDQLKKDSLLQCVPYSKAAKAVWTQEFYRRR